VRAWQFNSIASRIAASIALSIILGVALAITLGIVYSLELQRSYDGDANVRVFIDRSSVLTLNRRINLMLVSSRIATIAQAVSRAAPTDRPVVMAAFADPEWKIAIHDAQTLQSEPGDPRLDRLRDLVAFQLQSPPDAVRVGMHRQASRPSNARSNELLVEVRLPDANWLAVTMSDFERETGGFRLLIVLLVALALPVTLISIWTARRLTRPISAFAAAAERFGTSTEAVPLGESGPQELRAATRAFNQMQDRLRRFISDRTQMVAAMSHDLKTPLTRLRLRVELIRDKAQRHKMMADLDEMTAMIESTLAFARDDARRESPLLVDLGALVESVCENAIDAGGAVEVAAIPGVNVTCRPTAISRAVANLVDNALKYGGCARVRLDQFGNRVTVTVDDDGPGIPDDEREKVFAPFYRIESSRNRDTGGVGLGLAVARTAAREHGGDIRLDRAAGGGLRAQLELPLVDGSPALLARSSHLRASPDKACA
jgi:signal transduction histidine kinase